jgi:hypothetical protein
MGGALSCRPVLTRNLTRFAIRFSPAGRQPQPCLAHAMLPGVSTSYVARAMSRRIPPSLSRRLDPA